MAYNEFAYFYDEFNGEADYDALYSHIHSQLEAHGIRKVEIESEADGQVTFTAESADASDRRAEVSRALSQAGCTVLALAAENRTLEEVFLALTENESETPSDEGEEKTE